MAEASSGRDQRGEGGGDLAAVESKLDITWGQSMGVRWMASAGGPLLCAGVAAARRWRGVKGASSAGAQSDYERACETQSRLACIDSGGSPVLVLGDDPLQSTFINTGDGLMVARWHSCDSPDLGQVALSNVPSSLPQLEPPVSVEFQDPELVMFDSASSAEDIDDRLFAAIQPGAFMVTTELYRRERCFEFWLHRFVRIG